MLKDTQIFLHIGNFALSDGDGLGNGSLCTVSQQEGEEAAAEHLSKGFFFCREDRDAASPANQHKALLRC